MKIKVFYLDTEYQINEWMEGRDIVFVDLKVDHHKEDTEFITGVVAYNEKV